MTDPPRDVEDTPLTIPRHPIEKQRRAATSLGLPDALSGACRESLLLRIRYARVFRSVTMVRRDNIYADPHGPA